MAVKCPDCNTYNATHATACKKCGADLNPRTIPAATAAPAKVSVPWYKRLFHKGTPISKG